MKFQENARLTEIALIAPLHYRISLFSPNIAKNAKPGQFVMVKCENESFDPLLRRPISIHRTGKDTIELLFKTVGKGTRILSELKKGDVVNIIGPLGNEFTVNNDTEVAILIAGGVGVAPLTSLAASIKDKVKAVYAVIGADTYKNVICEKELKALGIQVIPMTDDGSYGKKGRATDAVLELLESKELSDFTQIFACGPRPMYRTLMDIVLQYKIECQVSLEEWMACGIGACNGCTVETTDGYKKVCKDGPIFDIKDIVWRT